MDYTIPLHSNTVEYAGQAYMEKITKLLLKVFHEASHSQMAFAQPSMNEAGIPMLTCCSHIYLACDCFNGPECVLHNEAADGTRISGCQVECNSTPERPSKHNNLQATALHA